MKILKECAIDWLNNKRTEAEELLTNHDCKLSRDKGCAVCERMTRELIMIKKIEEHYHENIIKGHKSTGAESVA